MPSLISTPSAIASVTIATPGLEDSKVVANKGKYRQGTHRLSPLHPPRSTSPKTVTTQIASGVETMQKHDAYYIPEGNTVIQVERTLFKVDLAVLQKHSPILQTITPAGGIFTDKHPLVLHEVTTNDFVTLLKVLYPLPTQAKPSTVEEYLSLLRISSKYNISSLIPLCTQFLHSQPLDPVRKIAIWDTYALDHSLLASAYADLCEAPLPLGLGTAAALGVKAFQRVVCAREMYRQRVGCPCCAREMNEEERRKIALEVIGIVFHNTSNGGMERKGSVRRKALK